MVVSHQLQTEEGIVMNIMKEDLPCNNCLVLAVCKHRIAITCDMLYDYVAKDISVEKLKMVRQIIKIMYSDKGTLIVRGLYNSKGNYVWL